eukprot:PLAT11925.1.p1 GENE.PLAT11925.1~~PLAT11925.1.p1  ORF type:complete len:517 (+),score=243.47 PLAT11925.1:62-1612(+)
MAAVPAVRLNVVGVLWDAGFQEAAFLVKHLAKAYHTLEAEVQSEVLTDWELLLPSRLKRLDADDEVSLDARTYSARALVTANDGFYIGTPAELLAWAQRRYGYRHVPNARLYARAAEAAFRSWMLSTGDIFCFMDVAVGVEEAERIIFQLYKDTCPKTAENFRALCTGEKGTSRSGVKLHYKRSPFHRVVKRGWVQGGDIVSGGGDGGESIYGASFPDESFSVRHDKPGMLSMSSDGPNTNNSQFFITLDAAPWLDFKRVAFGRVIAGFTHVRAMSELRVENERPVRECVVEECGEYVHAGKMPEEEEEKSSAGSLFSACRRLFNPLDLDGSNAVSPHELLRAVKADADRLRAVCGGEGVYKLSVWLERQEHDVAFEAFSSAVMEIAELCAADEESSPDGEYKEWFGVDARRPKTKKRFLDLRRPKTKLRKLRELFDAIDTSGDNEVDMAELLDFMHRSDSALRSAFPFHATELKVAFDFLDRDGSGSVTWSEFVHAASILLARPGGRRAGWRRRM